MRDREKGGNESKRDRSRISLRRSKALELSVAYGLGGCLGGPRFRKFFGTGVQDNKRMLWQVS